MQYKISRLKVFLLVCGTLLLLSGSAAVSLVASAQTIPAAAVRNADGSMHLTADLRGTVDLAGFQVRLDPQLGPILSPADTGTWDALGHGANGTVQALAISGNSVYVGGAFFEICGNATCNSGNLPMRYIARWSTTNGTWSALKYGVDAQVYALAVNASGDVFVGGAFKNVCGDASCFNNMTVNYIAQWSPSTGTWAKMQYGVNSAVKSIAASGNDLYVGGYFTVKCSNEACTGISTALTHIAKWTPATGSWSALGYGVYDDVYAIAVSGSDVYAGGRFTLICITSTCSGNLTVNHIAKWSTLTNSWSALGFGVKSNVFALAANGNTVYAGGSFSAICGNAACNTGNTPANNIAIWNGSAWSVPGYGVSSSVNALAVSGSNLYVGGNFTKFCGNAFCNVGNTPVNHFAKWNGSAWAAVGDGVSSNVDSLAMSGTNLYVSGMFALVCTDATCSSGVPVNHIAKFVPAAPTPTATPTMTPPPATATATATPTTGGCATPAMPTLSTPSNQSKVNTLRPTLKWTASNCASTYTVTVKDAATGTKVDSKTGLAALQYKTKALVHGKTYKWFVQACLGSVCAKSATWKFTVK